MGEHVDFDEECAVHVDHLLNTITLVHQKLLLIIQVTLNLIKQHGRSFAPLLPNLTDLLQEGLYISGLLQGHPISLAEAFYVTIRTTKCIRECV
jgi:hypothetical protein